MNRPRLNLRISTRRTMALVAATALLGWIGVAANRSFRDPDRRWLQHEWVARDDPGVGPRPFTTTTCRAESRPDFWAELLGLVSPRWPLCDHDRQGCADLGTPPRAYRLETTIRLSPEESWLPRAMIISPKTFGPVVITPDDPASSLDFDPSDASAR